jgi:hypothetical protein
MTARSDMPSKVASSAGSRKRKVGDGGNGVIPPIVLRFICPALASPTYELRIGSPSLDDLTTADDNIRAKWLLVA